jgi:hypothetical protein
MVCWCRSGGLALLVALAVVGCGPDNLPDDPILRDSGTAKPDAASPKLDAAITPDAGLETDTPVSEPDAGSMEDVATEPDAGTEPDAAETPDADPAADTAEMTDADPAADTGEMADADPAADAESPDTGPVVPPTPCTGNEECTAGICVTGTCRASSGLVLYWSFDDPDGSPTASDSSGNGLDGTFAGSDGTIAAHSIAVPPAIQFTNPSCRSLDITKRHGAQIVNMPDIMRLANNFSVSAWFRVKDMILGVSNGSEVLSAGDVYSLRVMPTQLEFSKRVLNQAGTGGSHIQVRGNATTQLDGNWHHLAGVSTPEGMKVYLDGVLLATRLPTETDPRPGRDIRYDRGNEFWIGRHGNGNVNYDFNGDIDDVRIYSHPLTDSDVAWLASGKP